MKPFKIPVRSTARLKVVWLLALLLLISGGLLSVEDSALEASGRFPMARFWGVVNLLSGGLLTWAVLRRKRSSTALILDATGLTDTVTGVGNGHVPWKDIRGFKFGEIQHQRVLFVILDKPQEYLKNRSLAEKLLGMVSEHRGYSSPVAIGLGHLAISEDELRKQLIRYSSAYHADALRNSSVV